MESKIILFGATGDLAKAKILPAFQALGVEPLLYGRKDSDRPNYIKGGLDEIYEKLKGMAITHAYVSLPPMYYEPVLRGIAMLPVTPRVALEKPFGISYADAQKLTQLIKELHLENDIYLVDHYLGKPALIELLKLSYEDRIHAFAKGKIAQISIDAFETNDVAARGAFYDSVGTIRDFVQNHIMAIISTLLMQGRCEGASTLCRQDVLNKLSYKPRSLVTGQYEGFKETFGVRPQSTTETFVSLSFLYDGEMEIKVRVGKALDAAKTEAKVIYKEGGEKIVNIQSKVNSYEAILKDFMTGGSDFCLSYDEALVCWKITENILQEKEACVPKSYPQGANPDSIN